MEIVRPTILVVDDQPENLEVLLGVLRPYYRVLATRSGEEALRAAGVSPQPDLVLLDIMMPDMDGFEVCRRFKKDESLASIPIIFLSLLNDVEDKVKAFNLGGVDYINKPFQAEEVEARVRTQIRLLESQREIQRYNRELEMRVAERTRELVRARDELREANRLKSEFLHTISHELRSPASGVLGVGELLLDFCPASDEGILYAKIFQSSALRLRNLLDDATMIMDMESLTKDDAAVASFPAILGEVRDKLPRARVVVDNEMGLARIVLKGNRAMLVRAMETVIQLAGAFSRTRETVSIRWRDDPLTLSLSFELDAVSLPAERLPGFFLIESSVRAASPAEPLGLAPVVAQRIISAFGGRIELHWIEGDRGVLSVELSTTTRL